MSTAALPVSHDQRKKELTKELESVLKASVSQRTTSREPLTSDVTQHVCSVVESLFIHGLRDPFFLRGSRYAKYPEPNFWPFVSKFTHRSITTQIGKLTQIKSEIGRSRAWVRLVLNEGALEHYLQVLIGEKKALGQFYMEEAYIRDYEHIERAKDMLKGLNGMTLAAPTNSALLNAWTPTPLILAGLVAGKPIRVATLAPHRRTNSKEEAEETGICALDLLPSSSSATNHRSGPSPIPGHLRVSPPMNKRLSSHRDDGSEDERSSVYSHPSMVADHNVRPPFTYEEDAVDGTSELVERRVKRRRNMSSRSSSDGSRKSANGSGEKAEEAKRTTAVDITTHEEEPSVDVERRKRLETSADSGVESEAVSVRQTPSVSTVEEGEEKEKEDNRTEEESPRKSEEEDRMNEEEADTDCSQHETIFNMSAETAIEQEEEKENVVAMEDGVSLMMELEEEGNEKNGEEILQRRDTNTPPPDPCMHAPTSLSPLLPHPSGASLVDEGVASPGGNSLVGRSWRISSRFSECSAEPTTSSRGLEGGRSSALAVPYSSSPDAEECSSSGGAASSGPPVSFGAALRRHVAEDENESSITGDDGRSILSETKEVFEGDDETESEEDMETLEKARKEAEARETVEKLTTLATEKGLDAQDFRCPMCKTTIGLATFRGYSVCGLDARAYCAECWQQGGESAIPGRMLHSWDTRPKKISPRSRAFLDACGDKPLIHVDQINNGLYDHAPPLKEVKELREKLQLVSMYLLNCRETVADDLRRRLSTRTYLIDDLHVYSYNDLLGVISGSLARQLRLLIKYATGHVFTCALCSQKGFVCEICNAGNVIYPFQTEHTARCTVCFSVFHAACKANVKECVKCERRKKYTSERHADHMEMDF